MTSLSLIWSYPVLSLVYVRISASVGVKYLYNTDCSYYSDVSNNAMETIDVWALSTPHGLFANNNSFTSFGNSMNLSESVKSLYVLSNMWTKTGEAISLM